jgi:hypothetical protein
MHATGEKADIEARQLDVRLTPKSGHQLSAPPDVRFVPKALRCGRDRPYSVTSSALGRFLALENPPGVDTGLAIGLGYTSAVAH